MNILSSIKNEWTDKDRHGFAETLGLDQFPYTLFETEDGAVLTAKKILGLTANNLLPQENTDDGGEIFTNQNSLEIIDSLDPIELWHELFPYPFCAIGNGINIHPEMARNRWSETQKNFKRLTDRLSQFEVACLLVRSQMQTKLILIHFVQRKIYSLQDSTESLKDLVDEFEAGRCTSESLGQRFKTHCALYAVDLDSDNRNPADRFTRALEKTIQTPKLTIEFRVCVDA